MNVLAIVTPTYNRAHTLPKLYDSLRRQTSHALVWYVVDDGSQDSTRQLVSGFLADQFPILYLHKENGGKHTAINFACERIGEELTWIVDSDDFLAEDAVETVCRDWEIYRDDPHIAGMSYYKLHPSGERVGDPYPDAEPTVKTYIQMRINGNVRGDKAEVYRTSLLRAHPFPVFPEERFLSEAVVWMEIGRSYALAFIPKGVYYCEYLQDGLSHSGRRKQIQNPRGTMAHAKAHLIPQVNLRIRWKYLVLYSAASRFAKMPFEEAQKTLGAYPVAFAISYFPGCLLHALWKRKYRDAA